MLTRDNYPIVCCGVKHAIKDRYCFRLVILEAINFTCHILPRAIVCPLLLIGDGWARVLYEPLQPDPVLAWWRWRVFSALKGVGLPAMAEDGKGVLWLGVTEGVWRVEVEDTGTGIAALTRKDLSGLTADWLAQLNRTAAQADDQAVSALLQDKARGSTRISGGAGRVSRLVSL